MVKPSINACNRVLFAQVPTLRGAFCPLPGVLFAWPRDEIPIATLPLIPMGARAAATGYTHTFRADPFPCVLRLGLSFTALRLEHMENVFDFGTQHRGISLTYKPSAERICES